VSYEDRTKAELQDELRDRDLPVSGSKQELVDRLTEDDDAQEETSGTSPDDDGDETTDGDDISTGGQDQDRGGKRLKPLQLARRAAQQLQQISGRRVDGLTGLEQAEEGWRVTVDLVEISRIPPSTDVLGSYEVVVDEDGDLVRYERIRRFIRGQAGEDMA
jgi:hypothetical protein